MNGRLELMEFMSIDRLSLRGLKGGNDMKNELFICTPVEWGIGEIDSIAQTRKTFWHPFDIQFLSVTKRKLPCFVVKLYFIKSYDKEKDKWFNCGTQGNTITEYLCLYDEIENRTEPTLAMEIVKRVFNWDGRSLVQLANGDYSKLEFQVIVNDDKIIIWDVHKESEVTTMKVEYDGKETIGGTNFSQLKPGVVFVFAGQIVSANGSIFIKCETTTAQTAVNLRTGEIHRDCCGKIVIPVQAKVKWCYR